MKVDRNRRALLGAVASASAFSAFPPLAWAQGSSIVVSWYPGVLGQNFKKGFLDTYKDAGRVKLVESFDNPRFTQMQANRNQPNIHVGVFTDVLLPLIARSGLVEEMSEARIPNLRDLDPRVKLPAARMAVPVTYGSWGIAYNSRQVKKPITSWNDLLRDDLKGHVSAPNITYNSSVYTLDALSSLSGGSLRSPAGGMNIMRQIRRSGPGLWDQESVAVGWLKTGEIWATPYFSGNVLALQRDPDLKDLRFANPGEGPYAVYLNVTRVKNPSAGTAPEEFINHMLSVPAQEEWSRVGGGRPVNVRAAIPQEVVDTVPTIDKLRRVDWEYFAENRSAIVEQWNSTVNS
jgi:putative spermidine/putrescine transport system substrate-binding protein